MYALICLVMATVCSTFSLQAMLPTLPPLRLAVTAALRMHVQPRFASSSVASAERSFDAYSEVSDINRVYNRFADCDAESLDDVKTGFLDKLYHDKMFPLVVAFDDLGTLDTKIDSALKNVDTCPVDREELQFRQTSVRKAMCDIKHHHEWIAQCRASLEYQVAAAMGVTKK